MNQRAGTSALDQHTRIAHVEGGVGCEWLRIRISPEALIALAEGADCDVAIGEPDAEGFVTPWFTKRPRTHEKSPSR